MALGTWEASLSSDPSEVGGPASYSDVLTSDIAGLWGAQERHDSCTVLRLTHSVWREERRLKP